MMKKAQQQEYEEEKKDLEQEKQELLSMRKAIQEQVGFGKWIVWYVDGWTETTIVLVWLWYYV